MYVKAPAIMLPGEIKVIDKRITNTLSDVFFFKDVSGYERCLNKSALVAAKRMSIEFTSFINDPVEGFELVTKDSRGQDILNYNNYDSDRLVVKDPRGFEVTVPPIVLCSLFRTISLKDFSKTKMAWIYVNNASHINAKDPYWGLINEDDIQYQDFLKESAMLILKESKMKSEAPKLSNLVPGNVYSIRKSVDAHLVYLGKYKSNTLFSALSVDTDATKQEDIYQIWSNPSTGKRNLYISRTKKPQHVFLVIYKKDRPHSSYYDSKFSPEQKALSYYNHYSLLTELPTQRYEMNLIKSGEYMFTPLVVDSLTYCVEKGSVNEDTFARMVVDYNSTLVGCEIEDAIKTHGNLINAIKSYAKNVTGNKSCIFVNPYDYNEKFLGIVFVKPFEKYPSVPCNRRLTFFSWYIFIRDTILYTSTPMEEIVNWRDEYSHWKYLKHSSEDEMGLYMYTDGDRVDSFSKSFNLIAKPTV